MFYNNNPRYSVQAMINRGDSIEEIKKTIEQLKTYKDPKGMVELNQGFISQMEIELGFIVRGLSDEK